MNGDWFNGDIEVVSGDRVVSLESLRVVEGYGLSHPLHQKYTSYIELTLHGLGGGGERLKTVQRIYFKQMRMDCATGDIFYNLVHDKQASVASFNRAASHHKVPRSIVVYVLIFRSLCIRCSDQVSDVIPTIPRRRYHMNNAASSLLHVDPNSVTDLDLRHLFATAVNILFSDSSRQGTLSVNQEAAQMCNHTESTHRLFYSSKHVNSEAIRFAMYHEFFGENRTIQARARSLNWEPISVETQLSALRLMCGSEASFHSAEQQQMVDICCNEAARHNIFLLPCGMGKTFSVLGPVVAEFLMKRQTGTRILVVPYGFLKDSLHSAFQERLRVLGGNINVVAVSASDISAEPTSPLPRALTESPRPPGIIIVTLDAAVNLIEAHEWIFQSWMRKNALSSIYIDEIQTMLTEFGFRRVYQAVRKYAVLGRPISLLSGSFHADLALPVMRYLGLSAPMDESADTPVEQDVNIIRTNQFVGSGFDFSVSNIQSSQELCAYIVTRAAPIHVICKDTVMAETLAQQLKESGTEVGLVHAKVPRADQRTMASKWYNGEMDVLVSTIVALVGNENPACKEIIVMGIVYNLSALVQAIGRLRSNQRGPSSRVLQVLLASERSSHERYINDSNTDLQQLIDAGVLSATDKDKFTGLFHYEKYLKFITTGGGCFIARLAVIFGATQPDCGRCTWCKYGRRTEDIIPFSPSPADEAADGQPGLTSQNGTYQVPTHTHVDTGSTSGKISSLQSSLVTRAETQAGRFQLRVQNQNHSEPPSSLWSGIDSTPNSSNSHSRSTVERRPRPMPSYARRGGAAKSNSATPMKRMTDQTIGNRESTGRMISPDKLDLMVQSKHQQGWNGKRRNVTQGTHLSLVKNPYLKTKVVSPVKALAHRAEAREAASIQCQRRALQVENQIIQSCPICSSNVCDGECVWSTCYVCGHDDHRVKECKYNKRKKLGIEVNRYLQQNGVCSLCCMLIKPGDKHGLKDDVLLCPGKKRFRALIRKRIPLQGTEGLSYGQYIRKIHASKETYYNYLIKGGF